MRKFRISYLILIFSLLSGNIAPACPNPLYEIPPPETKFFIDFIDSNLELNAIPTTTANTCSVKSFKPYLLHQAVLKLYNSSLPELHNQLIKIDQKIPQLSKNKYLNYIYDFQTIK